MQKEPFNYPLVGSIWKHKDTKYDNFKVVITELELIYGIITINCESYETQYFKLYFKFNLSDFNNKYCECLI